MEHLGIAESLSDFLNKTEGVHYHSREETRFFCRGQSSLNKRLRPKLGRYQYNGPRVKAGSSHDLRQWPRYFTSMFDQFEREYIAHHPRELNRKIDRMTLAQHYGLATPLLDWTLNPLVALYFACESKSGEPGVVFFFMPTAFPYISKDEDLENSHDVQLLRPKLFDQRMVNQEAAFSYHRDPVVDFGERLGNRCSGIVIPPGIKVQILGQLASVGFHKGFIYPGLGSACERIDSHYRSAYTIEQDKEFYKKQPSMTFDEVIDDSRTPYLDA